MDHAAISPLFPCRFFRLALPCALLAIGAGCHDLRLTSPERSVAEQLLLSTAADRAVGSVDLSALRGRTTYVEERYFESYDDGYAIGAIRQRLAESGALIVQTRDDADVIVEIRSGGLGVDTRESLVGIPAVTIPVPMAGPVGTPELALYKSQKADSTAKFALFAYERISGGHLHSAGPMHGTARLHHYRLLGLINWRRTDIPELDPKIAERLRREK